MIATLRNNHLPFAYVSISLFLSTSLNPLSYPPPPLLKNIWTKIWILDRELAFHLPSWLWRLKHFPSATWDVFEPLFLLVLLPFLFSWFVLPFHQFRLLPDVPVRIKLLHAFISFFLFFSLWLLFFFPSTCYFCSIPPPRIVLDPTANIQLVYVSHLTLCKDKTPPSFKCEWVIAKIKNLKKNVKNKHQKKNGKENSLNKTK